MGKKKSDGEKLLIFGLGAIGLIGLYYLTAGYDRKDNAALIPDAFEDRIDQVVGVLNAQFGKNWSRFGAEVLKSSLRKTLPATLVALVDAIYAIELESRRSFMSSYTKQQRTIAVAGASGLL